ISGPKLEKEEMNSTNKNGSNFYALLIGIDCYLPSLLPGRGYYHSLGGCVRDIAHLEEFLRNRLGLLDQQITKLTATNTGAAEPPEERASWPTYENIVKAF